MPRLRKGQRPKRLVVEVPESAYDAVESLEDSTGLDRRIVVSRVLEWLSTQDATTAKFIVGAIPDVWRAEFARVVLEKMANDGAEAEGSAGADSKALMNHSDQNTPTPGTRSSSRKRAAGDH